MGGAAEEGGRGPELLVELDRGGKLPLHAQLERRLRDAIRGGQLPPGMRLPSTRALAEDLGLTRGVVVEAYEQLVAGGYLAAKRGSGTVVAPAVGGEAPLRDAATASPPPRFNVRAFAAHAEAAAHPDALGAAGRSVRARGAEADPPRYDFRYGAPDLAAFPRQAWLAAVKAVLREAPDSALGYGDPRGRASLREELARYLNRARGTRVSDDGVLTTTGTVQALALACRTLRARGARTAAVEDPGWPAQAEAARRAGLEPIPVAVDREGISVEAIVAADPDVVLTTPAHQFPTGAVLSAARRRALVAWAQERGAVIVEDDYDAEYRYDRNPVAVLQGRAPEIVVYCGSVSKTLAPALRLGWLTAPAWLLGDLTAAQRADHRCGSALDELALAQLLARGELERHIRRTRPRYRRRREALVRALERHLPEARLTGAAAGLHALVALPPGVEEAQAVAAARTRGIGLAGLAELRAGTTPRPPAVLLSYAAIPEAAIERGVRELARAVAEATTDGGARPRSAAARG